MSKDKREIQALEVAVSYLVCSLMNRISAKFESLEIANLFPVHGLKMATRERVGSTPNCRRILVSIRAVHWPDGCGIEAAFDLYTKGDTVTAPWHATEVSISHVLFAKFTPASITWAYKAHYRLGYSGELSFEPKNGAPDLH